MATKTIVELVDDLDGSVADETVDFGADGVSYEIDLNTHNAEMLRSALTVYSRAARRVAGGVGRVKPVTRRSPQSDDNTPRVSKFDRGRLRLWASQNGYRVSDRGRIAAEVVHAWVAAGKP